MLTKERIQLYKKLIPVYQTYKAGYMIQHYVTKFVNGLRQVCGFLRVHQFPPPIKLTATI
jgi:hypothetical protein